MRFTPTISRTDSFHPSSGSESGGDSLLPESSSSAPWLRLRYRDFTATTSTSVSPLLPLDFALHYFQGPYWSGPSWLCRLVHSGTPWPLNRRSVWWDLSGEFPVVTLSIVTWVPSSTIANPSVWFIKRFSLPHVALWVDLLNELANDFTQEILFRLAAFALR